MQLCNNCGVIENLPTAILGTNTGLSEKFGGLSFLMIANCNAPTNTLGTVKTNWDTALTDQENYRAFLQCTMSGSQTENAAIEPAAVGSCNHITRPNNRRDGVATFVFREDNNSADIYKFFSGLDGKKVQFAVGACDDKSLYVFRKGTLFLGEVVTPENQNEYRTITVNINYTADATTYNLVGQTWAISDLVIP